MSPAVSSATAKAFMALSIACLFLLPPPSKSSENSKSLKSQIKCFHLRQMSEEAGNMEALVGENFAKYDNPINEVTYVIDGKAGEITVLNHRKKQYFVSKLDKWGPTTSYVNNILSFSDYRDVKLVSTKPGTSLGMPVKLEQYRNPRVFTGLGATKSERLIIISVDMTTCPRISSNANLIAAVAKMFCILQSDSYPLSFTYKNRKGGIHNPLKTSSIESMTISPEVLKVPANYTLGKTEREVYLDNAGHDTLEDMLK